MDEDGINQSEFIRVSYFRTGKRLGVNPLRVCLQVGVMVVSQVSP